MAAPGCAPLARRPPICVTVRLWAVGGRHRVKHLLYLRTRRDVRSLTRISVQRPRRPDQDAEEVLREPDQDRMLRVPARTRGGPAPGGGGASAR